MQKGQWGTSLKLNQNKIQNIRKKWQDLFHERLKLDRDCRTHIVSLLPPMNTLMVLPTSVASKMHTKLESASKASMCISKEAIITKMTSEWARLSWPGWNQRCSTRLITPWPLVKTRKKVIASNRLKDPVFGAQTSTCPQSSRTETPLAQVMISRSLPTKVSRCRWAPSATLQWTIAFTLLLTPQLVLGRRSPRTRRKRPLGSSSSRKVQGFTTVTSRRSCSKTGLSGRASTLIQNSWASTTGKMTRSWRDSKEWKK